MTRSLGPRVSTTVRMPKALHDKIEEVSGGRVPVNTLIVEALSEKFLPTGKKKRGA